MNSLKYQSTHHKWSLTICDKGVEEFEIEKILNKRIVREKEKFLVRWKGYMAEEDTWENRENLENAKELVEEFEREYRKEAEELR